MKEKPYNFICFNCLVTKINYHETNYYFNNLTIFDD